MTDEKITAFYEAAIEKTKARSLTWRRITASEACIFEHVDRERSFSAIFGNGLIHLIRDYSDGEIICWVKPDTDLSHQQIGEVDDPTLLRLYNCVYSLFPSVESFIDSFINDSPAE